MKLKFILASAALVAASVVAQSPCRYYGNTPIGTNLGLTDDSTRVIALPFAFPFHGTNYNVITVSSNGFVWLGINTDSDLSDSEAEMLSQGPRIAVCWDDLNPASTALPPGGGVFYNQSATTASVVWKDVPRYASTTIFMNMEVVLSASGEIDLYYSATCGVPNSTSIVGVSAGNGAAANAVDLSVLPTTPSPVINGGTGYELFATGVQDLVGTTTSFIPTSALDYLVINQSIAACAPNTPPNLPTYPTATTVPYGGGCPGPTSGTWFESFPASTIDLSNTSWRFTSLGGNNYIAGIGSGFDSSYTAADARVQGDDTLVNCPLTAMGSFPYLGSALTSVDVGSNGFLWMAPGNTLTDYSPSAAEFASLAPRLAPAWGDWIFTATAGTFYWTQTAAYCMATWENVQAYNLAGTANTFQCKLYINGDIEFNYGAILNNSTTNVGVVLVGLSGGASTALAPVDISAGTTPVINLTPSVAAPMVHTTGLPKIGTTYAMTTSVAPAGSLFGATLVGFVQTSVSLAPLGAPGCFKYVDSLAVQLSVLGGASTWTTNMPLPLDLGFVGIPLVSQGAVYVPGLNALGAASSNGVLGTIGL